jgi:hypothetical protein
MQKQEGEKRQIDELETITSRVEEGSIERKSGRNVENSLKTRLYDSQMGDKQI